MQTNQQQIVAYKVEIRLLEQREDGQIVLTESNLFTDSLREARQQYAELCKGWRTR